MSIKADGTNHTEYMTSTLLSNIQICPPSGSKLDDITFLLSMSLSIIVFSYHHGPFGNERKYD